MLTYTLIVLAIAAIGGVVLALKVFAGQLAPWSISIVHALLGATGLVMLIMVAGVLLVIGTMTALLAMVTGLVELGKIDSQSPAANIANQHMILILTSWSFYAVSLFLRLDGTQLEQPGSLAIASSVAGLIFLCSAGWMGGKLVYEYGVGIHPSSPDRSQQ